MKTTVVMQPSDAEMGEIIKSYLVSTQPFYNKIWLISAFANAQAIQRLTPNILVAKDSGAEISLIVGFDVKSTSAEALQRINSLGINAFLVHNARSGHTFHPKIYLFEATGIAAELFVGSNNLTDGGLYTNYEASTQTSFEFPQDVNEYAEITSSLGRYLYPQGNIVQILSEGLIETLVERGEVPSEREIRESQKRTSRSTSGGDLPASPFGVERIQRPPRLRSNNRFSPPQNQRTITPVVPDISPDNSNISNQYTLVWKKERLPATDAQRQPGNPTGGLRLVQAGWMVAGRAINQTVYFRYDIFGHLQWNAWRTSPYSERTETSFMILIAGQNYGIYNLAISHKPSGEAGQHNYTTILHWGDLLGTIRQLNLVGRTFNLYRPENLTQPFIIEIV